MRFDNEKILIFIMLVLSCSVTPAKMRVLFYETDNRNNR